LKKLYAILLLNSIQKTICRHRNQQLVIDVFVNLKLRMGLQELPNRCFGVVAWTPWTVGEHGLWHVFNNRIKNHTVTPDAGQWRVGFQLRQHMVMSVIAVKAYQYALIVLCLSLYLLNYT
jgi:hypothetical protein